MDLITDAGPPEFATGIAYALMTVFFAGPLLAFLGMYVAHPVTRGTALPEEPFPDALHAIARFALVLIALHACIVLPATAFIGLIALGDPKAWPLSLFFVFVLLLVGLVDARGLQAWTHIFRHVAQSHPVSVANWIDPTR
jgi:hypothetical protein